MFWKISGKEDSLSFYAEADTAEDAKETVETLTGYLKPEHITIEAVDEKDIPDEETVLKADL